MAFFSSTQYSFSFLSILYVRFVSAKRGWNDMNLDFQFSMWDSLLGIWKLTAAWPPFQFSMWDSVSEPPTYSIYLDYLSILYVRFIAGFLAGFIPKPSLSILYVRFWREVEHYACAGCFQFSMWDSSTYDIYILKDSTAFNSLCEIPLLQIKAQIENDMTFNSLCEIPAAYIFALLTGNTFQFSMWDSGYLR